MSRKPDQQIDSNLLLDIPRPLQILYGHPEILAVDLPPVLAWSASSEVSKPGWKV